MEAGFPCCAETVAPVENYTVENFQRDLNAVLANVLEEGSVFAGRISGTSEPYPATNWLDSPAAPPSAALSNVTFAGREMG